MTDRRSRLILWTLLISNWLKTTDGGQRHVKLDVQLLLDGSGSVSKENFEIARQKLRELPEHLLLDLRSVCVSLTVFDSVPITYANLTCDPDVYRQAVDDAEQQQLRRLSVTSVLNEATRQLEQFGRSNVPRTTVLIVDAGSTNDNDPVESAAQSLRRTGSSVYWLIIGQPSETSMRQALKAVDDPKRIFNISRYADLTTAIGGSIVRSLIDRLCAEYNGSCRYDDDNRTLCRPIWWWASDLNCSSPSESPPPCRPDDCATVCDRLWPWVHDGPCRDDLRPVVRRGSPQWPELLANCPKERCRFTEESPMSEESPVSDGQSSLSSMFPTSDVNYASVGSKVTTFVGPHRTTTTGSATKRFTSGRSKRKPREFPIWIVIVIACAVILVAIIVGSVTVHEERRHVIKATAKKRRASSTKGSSSLTESRSLSWKSKVKRGNAARPTSHSPAPSQRSQSSGSLRSVASSKRVGSSSASYAVSTLSRTSGSKVDLRATSPRSDQVDINAVVVDSKRRATTTTTRDESASQIADLSSRSKVNEKYKTSPGSTSQSTRTQSVSLVSKVRKPSQMLRRGSVSASLSTSSTHNQTKIGHDRSSEQRRSIAHTAISSRAAYPKRVETSIEADLNDRRLSGEIIKPHVKMVSIQKPVKKYSNQ